MEDALAFLESEIQAFERILAELDGNLTFLKMRDLIFHQPLPSLHDILIFPYVRNRKDGKGIAEGWDRKRIADG